MWDLHLYLYLDLQLYEKSNLVPILIAIFIFIIFVFLSIFIVIFLLIFFSFFQNESKGEEPSKDTSQSRESSASRFSIQFFHRNMLIFNLFSSFQYLIHLRPRLLFNLNYFIVINTKINIISIIFIITIIFYIAINSKSYKSASRGDESEELECWICYDTDRLDHHMTYHHHHMTLTGWISNWHPPDS